MTPSALLMRPPQSAPLLTLVSLPDKRYRCTTAAEIGTGGQHPGPVRLPHVTQVVRPEVPRARLHLRGDDLAAAGRLGEQVDPGAALEPRRCPRRTSVRSAPV